MSGSTGTPVGTPISSLPQATSTSGTDLLLTLQLDTTVTPNVLRPRLLSISILASALAITPEQFSAALTTATAAFPSSLPAQPGVLWNNDGVLALS